MAADRATAEPITNGDHAAPATRGVERHQADDWSERHITSCASTSCDEIGGRCVITLRFNAIRMPMSRRFHDFSAPKGADSRLAVRHVADRRPLRHRGWRWAPRAFSGVFIAAIMSIVLANTSAADSTADLRSQVDATRGGCAPLQSDPTLSDVAKRANSETQAYIEHTARFVPFEDPMPVLRSLGYQASKAKLLSGYGDADVKAIHGVIVQGWQAIPDCSYKRYGVDVLEGAGAEYALASVVLAGD